MTKEERDNKVMKEALEKILSYKKNPIRRVQYAGSGGYKAPDWIQTKDQIFRVVESALETLKTEV